MTVIQWHDGLLMAYAAMSVLVFVVLQFFIKASYGRHDTEDRAWWWGPGVPTRVAWVIMEAPSSIGFAVIYFLGDNAWQPVPLLLFALWQVHYFQRSFIYPFKRSVKPGDKTPLLLPLIALFTNFGISFLNASILSWSSLAMDYTAAWLTDPRLIFGIALFFAGYNVNRRSDAMLAALRKPGESGYKIPRGWLYEWVSCPNYLGEIMVWCGWALATWSSAGAVFLLWTLANLLPRALSNHQWYRQTFDNYPAHRKAVFPGIL